LLVGCRYGIGQIHLRQEKYADALHHFQLALRLKPQGSILHHCCGTALARLGRAQEALAAYSAAVAADPKNGVARFDRAQQLLEEGRVQEALADALALQVGARKGEGKREEGGSCCVVLEVSGSLQRAQQALADALALQVGDQQVEAGSGWTCRTYGDSGQYVGGKIGFGLQLGGSRVWVG
jgi:anaphase-promoting complex subunit 3